MAAVIILSDSVKASLAAALKAAIDVGGAAAKIDIYTGAIGDTAGSTKLATVNVPYPCGDIVGGKLVLGSIQSEVSLASGIAAWARIKTSAGATVMDVNISSTGGTAFMRLNTTSIIALGPVTITSCVFEF